MTLKDRVIKKVVAQFHRPTGFAGRLVGWFLALRSSNRRRNGWAVSLLEVQPADRVLEIGFGPGLAIRALARQATKGRICGIDHSEVMLRQARRRNRTAVREGRVDLRLASVDDIPDFGEPIDAILAVNSLHFSDDRAAVLDRLRPLLRPGGRIAVVTQPRGQGADAEATRRAGDESTAALRTAGFAEIRSEVLDLKPPVVCVLGQAPTGAPVDGGSRIRAGQGPSQ